MAKLLKRLGSAVNTLITTSAAKTLAKDAGKAPTPSMAKQLGKEAKEQGRAARSSAKASRERAPAPKARKYTRGKKY